MTTTPLPAEPRPEKPATGNLEPATCNPPMPVPKPAICTASPPRRCNGKIANLPKDQRDAINKLLLDGSTYVAVVDRMAEQGISLNAENVSNWYQSGFQLYLAHLERLDYQRTKYEAATDLLKNIDVSKVPEAGLQTAAAQIYDLLDRFTLDRVAATITEEPDKYIRMINSLSRLTREALAIQKYTDVRARAALRQLDAHRKLDEHETRAIVRKVDEILGLAPASAPPSDDESPSPQPPCASPSPKPPANPSPAPSAPSGTPPSAPVNPALLF